MQLQPLDSSPDHDGVVRPTHPGRRWPLGAGLVALAHLANDAVTSMLPALLPLLATRFRLAPSDLAMLIGAFTVSTSLPQPFFGSLADRLGAHRVGAAGLAVSALFLAALSSVSSVPWLCALLVIGGLGSSALHPAGIGLSRTASARSPGLAVALFAAAGMAGGASGPVLAIGITSSFGFEALAWAAAPVLVVAALFVAFAPRPPATVATPATSPRPGLRLLQGPVGGLAFVALCANVAMLTFASAVPVWLVRERGLPEHSPVIGLTLATFSLASAIGGILGGILARRVPPRSLVIGSLALSFVALESILAATPGSIPYFAAVAAAGALLYLHAPLVIVRAQELAPGAESAVAGILLGATSAAAGVIYVVLGAAQVAFGVGETMAAAFLVVLPAAHVAAVVLRTIDAAPAVATPRPSVAHTNVSVGAAERTSVARLTFAPAERTLTECVRCHRRAGHPVLACSV